MNSTLKQYTAEICTIKLGMEHFESISEYFSSDNEAISWAEALKQKGALSVILASKDGTVFIL